MLELREVRHSLEPCFKERDALDDRHPGHFKVILSAKTDRLGAVLQTKVNRGHNLAEQGSRIRGKTQARAIEHRNETHSLSKELRRLADALEGSKAQHIESHLIGAYVRENGKPDFFPYLAISGSDGWIRGVQPPPDMLLDGLREEVATVSKHSGWWSQTQTLALIMCGGMPLAGVSTNFSEEWHGGNDEYKGYTATTITLTVRGPAPEEEVIDAYREVLKNNGLRPKKLSLKQYRILQLVEQTPETSWAKRYERWLEWCDLHPDIDLPRYTEKSGAASLHKEHQRALKAASWGKENDS